MEKSKQNCRLNRASGERVNALRVEYSIAGRYKLMSRTIVAQIQWEIKARRCATKLVVLVKISG